MKRKDLIKQLIKAGCILVRHGSRHDIYLNPGNGKKQPIPRHTEVDEQLSRHIKKFLGIEEK
ncbi:MAG: type II toxin-antitoxin system HicA family toxin [Acidobacteriota bacterium]|nr:type II toxin-antitoxin system HicA family toxin [Acidobacteriota bacterium]